jgi:surface antigen
MRDRLHGRARCGVHALSIALVCGGLAACTGGEYGSKQSEGQEIGSIIGGIVGPYIPGGSVAAQIARNHGDVIGGLIGQAIGAALDEEDRLALEKSTREAFESGKNKSFSNKKTGVAGSVKVTGTRTEKGRQCRTVQQDVKLKDGTALKDTVSACKGPNGWEV